MVVRSRQRLRQHAGFTLTELMIASAIALFLMAVAFQMLLQAAHLSSIAQTRSDLNAQAREVLELLLDGGVVDVAPINTIDDADVIEGLHSASGITVVGSNVSLEPTTLNSTLSRDGQRLQWSDGVNAVKSSQLDQAIECVTTAVPHPDCSAAGSVSLNGFIASDVSIAREMDAPILRCGGNQSLLVSIEATLMDPYALFRFDEFDSADYRFLLSSSAALNVDCAL